MEIGKACIYGGGGGTSQAYTGKKTAVVSRLVDWRCDGDANCRQGESGVRNVSKIPVTHQVGQFAVLLQYGEKSESSEA